MSDESYCGRCGVLLMVKRVGTTYDPCTGMISGKWIGAECPREDLVVAYWEEPLGSECCCAQRELV